jgi:hypothetical protein
LEKDLGEILCLADEPNYKLKRIEVNPGQNILPISSQKTRAVDHY